MRKLLIALSALALATVAVGPALGHTPHTGSHEGDTCVNPDDETDTTEPNPDGSCPDGYELSHGGSNEVTCGDPEGGDVPSTETPLVDVYAQGDAEAQDGTIEACADDENSAAPLQGRVIVTGSAEEGGYVAADGDNDNPEDARGWARVDVDPQGAEPVTVRCGDENGNLDSTHPGDEDGQEDCGQ